MEFVVVTIAILLILLVAKNGSSKRTVKPKNDDPLDEVGDKL